MIILKLFYLLYTSFILNDQSTDSVVLKAKLQQQMLLHKMYSRKKMMEKITSHGPFLLYLYSSANIDNQALY